MNYNPYSLREKNVLVLGASSGIGREVAILCSQMGATLSLIGRNNKKLAQTISMLEGEGHTYYSCDITCDDDVERIIPELPKMDGLCNCVGISKVAQLKFLNRNSITDILNTNTLSPILFFQQMIRKKKMNKPSSVVFIGSLSGIYNVHFGDSLNATSKTAINGFVKSAALDLGPQGIRVNCVNPGIVATEAAYAGTILSEEEMNEKQKYFPLKRFGHPRDIANAVVFLLSDASTWITGVNIPIDGGYSIL